MRSLQLSVTTLMLAGGLLPIAAAASPVVVTSDFTQGPQGWTAFFADHPPGVDNAWQFDAGLAPLPEELGIDGTGFKITGNNHSDDLAMALKKRLGTSDGIHPGQMYWVEFEIDVASNAPSGAVGVGGSPGDSVYLKAGASATEPAAILVAADQHLRPTINVGFQSLGGPAATVLGVIANGRAATAPPLYVTLQRTHRHRFPVRAADDGTLWLLVMTDSAFEGPTTLYYQRIRATLTPISATTPQLSNLATRAEISGGEGVLVAGFVVGGGGTGTYLIRGVGPTLADYGVSGTLANPTLAIKNSTGATVASNDNWSESPDPVLLEQTAAAVGAFPLRANSADAAVRVELPAGLYSAILEGVGGTTGVGLVEVYAVDTSDDAPRLINLSARARIGAGEKAVFPGLYLRGPDPQQVLIRAVGPGLVPYGITNPAPDPIITLFKDGSPIATNVAWQYVNAGEEVSVASARSGAFPLLDGSRDAALVATLEPGLYAVQIEEASSTLNGIVLVEIYAVR